MIGTYTAHRAIWKAGVYWELEVQFSINNDDEVVLEGAEFLGWYPEFNSRGRDYVPVGIKIELDEIDMNFHDVMQEMANEAARYVDENDDGDY